MDKMTLGSLFSGYGGLDIAVSTFFNAETSWFAEVDPYASMVLESNWPDVPNLGNVMDVDWSSVAPVDIIAGGSPCQDLSIAGARKGMDISTRSGLWGSMIQAIDYIKPKYVIWENVKGARSAGAVSASDLEHGDGQMGNLKALGRVLGDLSEVGYNARWVSLRASDCGAPHHRERVFVLGTLANSDG